MKKIMYICLVLIVVAVTALLYSNTSMYNQNNIKRTYIEGTTAEGTPIIELDQTDAMVEKMTKKLNSLKQYKTTKDVTSVISKTLIVEKTFGRDEAYDIILDHDFGQFYLKDLSTDITYVVDDELTEWIYMHEAFKEIYDYKEIKEHHIIINEDELTTISEIRWQHVKADAMWYEDTRYQNNLNRIVVKNGVFELNMLYDELPESSILRVFEGEALIHESDAFKSRFVPEDNGLYLYEIETKWQSELKNGTQKSTFEVMTEYPPKFEVSDTQIEQGQMIVIMAEHIVNPDSLYIDQSYLEGIRFEKNGDRYECVIPATYYTTPGEYTLSYGVKGYDYSLDFEILPRDFELQYLTVDKETTQSTQTAEAYAEYNQYYKTALMEDVYQPEENFLEESLFILPTTGRVTTEFGVQRYVNNKLTSYHHAGLDIANDKGTPIVATFDGEVVLAQFLTVTGNTVVISHGHGIFSTYFHMETIETEKGKKLKTGDPVGTVGTTGFSTGPHLHFSISYYKMNLEPGYFIFGEKVTYKNYESLFTRD